MQGSEFLSEQPIAMELAFLINMILLRMIIL